MIKIRKVYILIKESIVAHTKWNRLTSGIQADSRYSELGG